jgi:hypothetical protein
MRVGISLAQGLEQRREQNNVANQVEIKHQNRPWSILDWPPLAHGPEITQQRPQGRQIFGKFNDFGIEAAHRDDGGQ